VAAYIPLRGMPKRAAEDEVLKQREFGVRFRSGMPA
jgi:hypothetical protein